MPAEAGRSLGKEKSKVLPVLTTFRRYGWLAQNPRIRPYRVGLRAYALGAPFRYSTDLTRAVEAACRDELFAVAREVSAQLGAQSYPFDVRRLQPQRRKAAR